MYDVLFVDDDKSAAETYAELLTAETGLAAVATDDPDHAVELVSRYPIKVAVLDQKMPKQAGTVLFPRLQAVDRRLRGILLTGQATLKEVGQAVELFDLYLAKSQARQALSSRVFQQYAHYVAQAARDAGQAKAEVVHKESRGLPCFRHHLSYVLATVEILDPGYVPEEEWRTIVQVNAGEKKSTSVVRERSIRYVYEQETREELRTKLSVKGGQIATVQGGLESAVSARPGVKTEVGDTETVTEQLAYELPPPPGPGELYVASRLYQRAPVYRRLLVGVVRRCSSCGANDPLIIRMLQRTQEVATRQVDHLSDGRKEVNETGHI